MQTICLECRTRERGRERPITTAYLLFKHIDEDIRTQSVGIELLDDKNDLLVGKDYLYLSICQISSKYLVGAGYIPRACATSERSDHISSNDTIMVLYKKMCLLFYL